MLHSTPGDDLSRSITDYLELGAKAWGRNITPSISHLVTASRKMALRYSSLRPNIVVEGISATAMLPHFLGDSVFRFHTESERLRTANHESAGAVDGTIGCMIGKSCVLKLWGRIAEEVPGGPGEGAAMIPVYFKATFWELSKFPPPEFAYVDPSS